MLGFFNKINKKKYKSKIKDFACWILKSSTFALRESNLQSRNIFAKHATAIGRISLRGVIYFHFLLLITRLSATLSANLYELSLKLGGESETECLNTGFPLPPCYMQDTAWSYIYTINILMSIQCQWGLYLLGGMSRAR